MYVSQEYTTQETTETLQTQVDADGREISAIKGTNTTQIPTRNLAQLSIWLDSLQGEVTRAKNFVNTISNQNRVVLTNVMEGDLLSLNIKGEMSLTYFSEDLFFSDTLYFKSNNLYVQYENGDICSIDLPFKILRKMGTVCDEFVLDADGARVIKRIGVTEENVPYILTTPETINYDFFTIPLKSGINTLYLPSFQNDDIEITATYAIQNEFTDVFATRMEQSAKIIAAASAILLEVSEYIESPEGAEKIVSSINLSPDTIKLLARKLILEGLVTANGYFKILQDGSMEAINGKFSGRIEANEGYFTGDIYLRNGQKALSESDGVLTNLYYCTSGRFQDYNILGFGMLSNNSGGLSFGCQDITLDIDIPENFVIKEAYVTVYHTPAYWSYWDSSNNRNADTWGWARSLKLYKATNNSNYKFYMTYGGEYEFGNNDITLSEISNAFNATSYTPSNHSGSTIEAKSTIDIKSNLSAGKNKLVIRSADSVPSNEKTCCQKTGMARASINIIGYLSN